MLLAERLTAKENNFNVLRFIAASFVMVSHSYDISKIAAEPLVGLTGYLSFGFLAVFSFFSISGFLITRSWLSDPRLIVFCKKRFLRLFPALAFAILFSAFVIGPLVTNQPLRQYLANPYTISYLKNVFLFPLRDYLPGVFVNNPMPFVNGSLWTLPIEVSVYVMLLFLGMIGLAGRRYVMFFFFFVLLFLDIAVFSKTEYASVFILTMPAAYVVRLGIFFFAGSLFYLYREMVVINSKIIIGALLMMVISFRIPYGSIICYFVLPYLVFCLAFSDIPLLRYFTRKIDVSYGVYIYAFPVQQTLLHFFDYENALVFFISSYVLTLTIAFLSWTFIEKPCLRLKERQICLKQSFNGMFYL